MDVTNNDGSLVEGVIFTNHSQYKCVCPKGYAGNNCQSEFNSVVKITFSYLQILLNEQTSGIVTADMFFFRRGQTFLFRSVNASSALLTERTISQKLGSFCTFPNPE